MSDALLYTKEDLQSLIEACNNVQDMALISLMYESALRPSELANLKWGDVRFEDTCSIITVKDKNGWLRHIPITMSHKYLVEWMNDCHLALNRENFVFVNNQNKPLQYNTMIKRLRAIGERAGISEAIKTHGFRHSRIEPMLKPTCKRCNTPISSTSNYCPHCGLPQNEKAREEIDSCLTALTWDIANEMLGLKAAREIEPILEDALTTKELDMLNAEIYDEMLQACYDCMSASICKDWN